MYNSSKIDNFYNLFVDIPPDFPDIFVLLTNENSIIDMCERIDIKDTQRQKNVLKMVKIILKNKCNSIPLQKILDSFEKNFNSEEVELLDIPNILKIFVDTFNTLFKSPFCFSKKYKFDDVSNLYKILVFFMMKCGIIQGLEKFDDDVILIMLDNCLKLLNSYIK